MLRESCIEGSVIIGINVLTIRCFVVVHLMGPEINVVSEYMKIQTNKETVKTNRRTCEKANIVNHDEADGRLVQ